MNLKISLLSVILIALPVCSQAQTARNPLNHEPAQVILQKGISSWKLSEEIFYHADEMPFEKRCFLYDENGRKTAELKFDWHKADRTWNNTAKSEYQLEKGKEIVINWERDKYTTKTETFPGTDGKPQYAITRSWNNATDDWSILPSMLCEWQYDANGRLTACLKKMMNPTTSEWNDYHVRIVYTYDATGVLLEETYQSWNTSLAQWTARGRYSYTDGNNMQKVATSYFYAANDWVFDGKTVYNYDNEGKIVRSEYYRNSTDKTPDAFSVFTYSETATLLPEMIEPIDIQVFPNPAVSFVELTVPKEYFGKTMQLFDVFGKLAMTQLVTNPTTRIDVTRLTSGVYLLKIGESAKKIVVQ